MEEKYNCFIGRFVTFHDGHRLIMRKVWRRDKLPLVVMVMDTDEHPLAEDRSVIIKRWMLSEDIPGRVGIIPPIHSINYGRNVGYKIRKVRAPKHIEAISGKKIRESEKQNRIEE